MNIENISDNKIAIIISNDKLNKKIISITDEDDENDVKKPFTEMHLTEGRFQMIPNMKLDRGVHYVCGPSGSGKSYFCVNYINQYIKKYKKANIYLLSSLDTDDTIDRISNLQRLKIDDSIVENPLKIDEFSEHDVIIFDDIDVIGNKALRGAVYSFLDQCLEIGRHMKLELVITNHLCTNGRDTRRVLNECHTITLYPKSGSAYGLNYLLSRYVGLDKKDIVKLKKLKSRHVTIFKHAPQFVMSEKDIYLLNND